MGYGSQAGCGAECKAGKGRSKTLSYHEYGDMITSQKVKGCVGIWTIPFGAFHNIVYIVI